MSKTNNDPKVWVAGEELQKWVRVDLTAMVGNLEGQWLTLIDATFTDPQQRKAMKDLVRKMIWNWDMEIIERVCPKTGIGETPDGVKHILE